MAPDKLDLLSHILSDMKNILVAFSGGTDSSFLVKVAHDELQENVLAVTATSEIQPSWELEEAKQ